MLEPIKITAAAGYCLASYLLVRHHGIIAGLFSMLFTFVMSFTWFSFMESKRKSFARDAWWITGLIGSVAVPFALYYLDRPWKELVICTAALLMTSWLLWCRNENYKRECRAIKAQDVI